MPQRQ